MSLEYLNGIGASRKKSGGGGGGKRKKAGSTSKKGGRHKGALKRIIKAAPKNPIAAARMAKKIIRKSSPLNAVRIKKALAQERQRAVFEENDEPIKVDDSEMMDISAEDTGAEDTGMEESAEEQGAEDQGMEEVAEEQGDDMGCIEINGLLYPASINGKARKAKKAAKTDKKKAGGEAKRVKAQAKLEKAKTGGGKAAAFLNKGLDTANKYLDSKAKKDAPEEKESGNFFSENKGLIIGGGLGLAALLIIPKMMKSN